MTLRLIKVSLGRFSNSELGAMSSNEVHGVVRSGDSAGNTNEVCNEKVSTRRRFRKKETILKSMGRVQLLDTYVGNSYNIFTAEVAQSVEQRAEIAPRGTHLHDPCGW